MLTMIVKFFWWWAGVRYDSKVEYVRVKPEWITRQER
jgi:hypothetical protein